MVTSMVKYGAIVTPAERETLVHYYTSAYRP
jgi:hypothetical protein